MKTFFQALGLTIVTLLVAGLVYSGVLYMGWLPVPKLVTDQVARWKHLNPQQAETLQKTAELYSVVKTSPDAGILDEALKMAREGHQTPETWMRFAADNYHKVSQETLEKARSQLDISEDDYQKLKTLWEKELNNFTSTGKIQVSGDDKVFLQRFDEEYQITTLLRDLK